MEFHKEQWAARLANEEHGGLLVPIFALAHEHDPDPEMRPYKDAIGAEKREKLIVGAAAGVTGIYRYFKEQRLLEKEPFDSVSTFRRRVPKIGRRAAICLQVALLETQVKFAISQDAETSINKVQLPIPIHAVAPSHQRRAV